MANIKVSIVIVNVEKHERLIQVKKKTKAGYKRTIRVPPDIVSFVHFFPIFVTSPKKMRSAQQFLRHFLV